MQRLSMMLGVLGTVAALSDDHPPAVLVPTRMDVDALPPVGAEVEPQGVEGVAMVLGVRAHSEASLPMSHAAATMHRSR